MAAEEWREVTGLPFRVSSHGRVQRHTKRAGWTEPTTGTPLGNGYLTVSHQRRHLGVHVLVALAFRGPKPQPTAVARHLNDVSDDNRAENIAWGSRSENVADAVRNGRRAPGARERVIALAGDGLRTSEIARLAGVSPQRVHQIVTGYRSPANLAARRPVSA